MKSAEGPHTRLWRRLDVPGHEWAQLRQSDQGHVLEGTTVYQDASGPCCLRYQVRCDDRWHTTSALVEGHAGHQTPRLDIAVDGQGRWRVNGGGCDSVKGCLDLDLACSPATNLLTLCRLNLEIGESAAVCSAWLQFPECSLSPLRQTYRRTGLDTYDYSAFEGAFRATLAVDALGFVVRYPGLWELERYAVETDAPGE